ncbi:alpha-N-acetylgalactosaminidase-like [Convolutriloba macropyga]|uniref:alpha-N-acetylgalactosaminidase-like n=1 Tax=Convolutriloba macropyga TaxID=536237 RepID=UPI003F51EEDF
MEKYVPCRLCWWAFLLGCLVVNPIQGDPNGLGLTPVMGFMNWERFRCQTDCVNFPRECVNEDLFKTMADAMVTNGMKDAGYTYLSIDDCWLSMNRTEEGRLQPDPTRFPSGMKSLAQYMHQRGLKLGIYEDVGVATCAGYPGSEGYEDIDAQTFAAWDIDMLKFDGCNVDQLKAPAGYEEMGKALAESGRDILYVCEWPWYDPLANFSKVSDTCNAYRVYNDVEDSWDSIYSIIKHMAQYQDKYATYSGPGHFVDPDQLVVGDPGTSYGQQKIQMSMWSMWSAPLLVSSDLRNIDNQALNLLLNRFLIRINQDPLGSMAKQVISSSDGSTHVWLKTLGDATFGVNAICSFRARNDDQTVMIKYSLKQLGVMEPPSGKAFSLIDAFTGKSFSTSPILWDTEVTLFIPDMDAIVWIVQYVDYQNKTEQRKITFK